MSYFKQFPKVDYDFNRTGSITKIIDIFRSVRPLPEFVDTFSAYKFYNIKNGERPDIVSSRLYGRQDLYWTFFIVNDFLHDGYRSWPMTQEDLYNYMLTEYKGKVIEVNPTVLNNETINSIAGKFKLGETITGATSGATGKLVKKNTDMAQLILKNVSGSFRGNMHEGGGVNETVTGATSTDSVNTFRVYDYADAPYYYYNKFDGEKKPITSALHITGGTPTFDLAFQSYREFEYERNDERSQMRYVDPNYIERFIDKFEDLINV